MGGGGRLVALPGVPAAAVPAARNRSLTASGPWSGTRSRGSASPSSKARSTTTAFSRRVAIWRLRDAMMRRSPFSLWPPTRRMRASSTCSAIRIAEKAASMSASATTTRPFSTIRTTRRCANIWARRCFRSAISRRPRRNLPRSRNAAARPAATTPTPRADPSLQRRHLIASKARSRLRAGRYRFTLVKDRWRESARCFCGRRGLARWTAQIVASRSKAASLSARSAARASLQAAPAAAFSARRTSPSARDAVQAPRQKPPPQRRRAGLMRGLRTRRRRRLPQTRTAGL